MFKCSKFTVYRSEALRGSDRRPSTLYDKL